MTVRPVETAHANAAARYRMVPAPVPSPTSPVKSSFSLLTSHFSLVLDMNYPSHRVERRFRDSLREGGVGVNRQVDFLHRVLVLPRDRQLVNDLGGMPAHDVGPQDLAVFPVPDDLHEALGLTGGAGPAVGAEGKPAYLVIELLFLGLFFRQPDARH